MQRQQIPHQIYKDNSGVEHVRVSTFAVDCHLALQPAKLFSGSWAGLGCYGPVGQ